MNNYIQYKHHGAEVYVDQDMKDRHFPRIDDKGEIDEISFY